MIPEKKLSITNAAVSNMKPNLISNKFKKKSRIIRIPDPNSQTRVFFFQEALTIARINPNEKPPRVPDNDANNQKMFALDENTSTDEKSIKNKIQVNKKSVMLNNIKIKITFLEIMITNLLIML
jgi:hypothetical protein